LEVRVAAASALADLGADPDVAVPGLLEMCGKENEGYQAVRTLARLGKAAVPALVKALGSDRAAVGEAAAPARAPLKAHARPAGEALGARLTDADEGVRLEAAAALLAVAPDQPAVVPVLAELLDKSKDKAVRESAALHLQDMGTQAKAALPALRRAADEPAEGLRLRALQAWWAVGADAEAVVPRTVELLKKGREKATRT